MGVIWAPSIMDPLADGFVDQPQQERGGGGLKLAVETEMLGSEVGTEAEDLINNSGAIGEEGGLGTILKGRSIAYNIFNKQSELCFSLDDQDSADYLTSIRTNRYYLRIFCWALDRVLIHTAYVVEYFLIKSDIGQKQWKRYLDHHSGRHDFQIDLALSVMNYGIGLQWDGESDKRPNCNNFFFF